MWIEEEVNTMDKQLKKSRLARALWIEVRWSTSFTAQVAVEARESLVDRSTAPVVLTAPL